MWRAEGSGLTLTREVDGVQRDPLGLDETSDPLQLSLAHVVLEEDVVGEAHAADGLGALAADCDVAVAGVNLESHGLRDGALVVLHSASSWTWRTIEGKRFRMSACQKSDWVFFRDTMPAAVSGFSLRSRELLRVCFLSRPGAPTGSLYLPSGYFRR